MSEKTILSYLGDSNVQISTLIILLVFYILTRNPWFGALTLIAMLGFLIIEFYIGTRTHGMKKEILETIAAFALAFITWQALVLFLNTDSPISAVVSCSMVDYINRGDMIFIKGTEDYNALYTIKVSDEDISSLNTDNARIIYNDMEYEVKGSIFSTCQNSYDNICLKFKENPTQFREIRGNFEFIYDLCKRTSKEDAIEIKEACIVSLKYKEKEYKIEKKGDVVVYIPKQSDLFYQMLKGGDIIHRAIVKLEAPSGVYYLTKGDNNNVFDMQFYYPLYNKKNSVVNQNQIKGKMIGKIPFLGYYKLFLIGSFEESDFCSFVLDK